MSTSRILLQRLILKVYNYRKIQPDQSRTKVIKMMLQGRLMEPTLITGISIVAFDRANMAGDNQSNNIADVIAERQSVLNSIRGKISEYHANKANEDTFAQDDQGGKDQVSNYIVSDLESFQDLSVTVSRNGNIGRDDGNASASASGLSLSLGGFTSFSAEEDQSYETWNDDAKDSKNGDKMDVEAV